MNYILGLCINRAAHTDHFISQALVQPGCTDAIPAAAAAVKKKKIKKNKKQSAMTAKRSKCAQASSFS